MTTPGAQEGENRYIWRGGRGGAGGIESVQPKEMQ